MCYEQWLLDQCTGQPILSLESNLSNHSLPKVINYLAAQTLILNQDRCTKNFMVYLDKSTDQWNMLAWDVESGFGIDRGLGGQPAPDYCTLQCEQWNSPLYCDHNHTQDLVISTPYGLIR